MHKSALIFIFIFSIILVGLGVSLYHASDTIRHPKIEAILVLEVPEEKYLQQTVKVLTSRLKEYGFSNTEIKQESAKRISVNIPKAKDMEEIEKVINNNHGLEFRLVKSDPASQEAVSKIYDLDEPFNDDGTLTEEAKKFLPKGTTVMKNRDGGYLPVADTVPVSGADIEDARVTGEYGFPAVFFTFNSNGAKKFGALTGANVGRQLAIVLDNIVQSAPRINNRISAQGQITGQFTKDEAKQIAIALKTGTLPAPVKIIEKKKTLS